MAPNPLDPLEKQKVTFITDLKGDISSLSMPLESMVKPIVFERVAEKRMFDPAFLTQFTGSYDMFGSPANVRLEGTKLVISHPGSPVLTLAPKYGMTFDIESRPGQSLEFRQDASGKIAEAVLYTPDGVYVIKKK